MSKGNCEEVKNGHLCQNKVPEARKLQCQQGSQGRDLEGEVSHSGCSLPGSKLDDGISQGVCDTRALMEQRAQGGNGREGAQ